MRTYEELATEIGNIASDLLGLPLRTEISLISDNDPDFAMSMWLEYLNYGGRRLPVELLDEAEGCLPDDTNLDEFDRHLVAVIAENRALPNA